MRRIVVTGASGAGKTTLAKNLADRLGLRHVELDALHWGPNWTSTPTDLLRPKVEAATESDGWALCGNYSTLWRTTLARADTVVWLDYPMTLVVIRVFLRTVRRCISREPLWGNNAESWSVCFFSRESVILWCIRTWRTRRQENARLFRSGDYPHLQKIRFTSPDQTQAWLEHLPRNGSKLCPALSNTK